MKKSVFLIGALGLLILFVSGCASSAGKEVTSKISYAGDSGKEINFEIPHPPASSGFCYYLNVDGKEMPAGTTYNDLAYNYPLPSVASMWLEYKLYKGVRTDKGIFLNSCAGSTRVHWVCDGKAQKNGNWIIYISGPGTQSEKLSMHCPSVIDPKATCSTHFVPPGLTVSIVNCKSKEHLIGIGYGCMDKGDDDSDGKIDCKDSDCNNQFCDANKLTKKCKKFQCVDFSSPIIANATNNGTIIPPINATNATIIVPVANTTNSTAINATG